jgi:hypothetical protein
MKAFKRRKTPPPCELTPPFSSARLLRHTYYVINKHAKTPWIDFSRQQVPFCGTVKVPPILIMESEFLEVLET